MDCKNCKTYLSDKSKYCYACGGKVIRNRLTLKNLFQDFSETYLNYDNTFFKTFIHLFTKPEQVIGGYIDGVRKKYVNVISYFMIALTITGLEWFILRKYFPETIDLSAISYQKNNKIAEEVFNTIQDNISLSMMLLVPLYALISRIVFLNIKKYIYTEHLVIFMYILAQVSIFGTLINIAGAFVGISIGKLTYIIFPFQIIYSAYCLAHLYKLSLKGIILRTLLFVVVFLVIYLISIIIGGISLYLIKGPEFFKEFIEVKNSA
ncbi:MAG: DUF3667 domain-containing protein [Gelidibacter sp.]